jgi:GABA(A) receptor-associated protein
MAALIDKIQAAIKMPTTLVGEQPFRLQWPLEKRKAEAQRIRAKYPDRIPVIVEKSNGSTAPDIDKKKYLVPADLTMSQFVYVVRKRIKLGQAQSLFLFLNNNTLPTPAQCISLVYKEHKNEDGFLYITYDTENTFG